MMTMLVVDLHHPRPRASKISFYVKVPNLTDAEISEASPAPGQTTTVSEEGTVLVDGETYKTRSATVSTGPATVANSGTLICEGSDCESGPDKEYQGFEVKQGSTTITHLDNETELAELNDGAATLNERFLIVRTSTGQAANLQSAYYGEYTNITQTGTVDTSGEEPEFTPTEGSATNGHFFGGTATSSGDMDTLKNSSVTATYLGSFYGFAAAAGRNLTQEGAGADLIGKVSLTANFGSAEVEGNVYDLQRRAGGDNCQENCTESVGYGLAMEASISGATYSGTSAFTEATDVAGAAPIDGSATGQVIGGFYGANAGETAGAIRIVGDTPAGATGPGTGDDVFVGSDGAVREAPAP